MAATSIQILGGELEAFEKLQREGLSVGVMIQPLRAYACYAEEDCPVPGYNVEIMRVICDILNVTCRYVTLNHTMYGDNLDGEWRGAVGEILKGLYNISLSDVSITERRLEVIDFSDPVETEGLAFVSTFSQSKTFRPNSLLFGFTTRSWILLINCILLIGLICSLLSTAQSFRSALHNFVNFSILALAGFCGKDFGGFGDISRGAARVVRIWGLFSLILAAMYSSQTVSQALDSFRDLPYTDMESLADCVSQFRCRAVAKTSSQAVFELINAAEAGPFAKMKSALAKNPLVEAPIGLSILQSQKGMRSVFLVTDLELAALAKNHTPCTFSYVEDEIVKQLVGFSMPKNSPFKSFINRAIQLAHEHGRIAHLQNKYFGHIFQSQKQCLYSHLFADPVPVEAASGAFVIVLIGGFAALLILLLEKTRIL